MISPQASNNSMATVDAEPSNHVSNISTSPLSSPSPQLTDNEPVQKQIRSQIEFYFSPSNLMKDVFMKSKMNEQGFVKLSVIADFPKIKQLLPEGDIQTIVSAIQDSSVCELDEEKKAVKAKLRVPRNIIILRDVPATVTDVDIVKLFAECNLKPTLVRLDVLATWYVHLATEQDAKDALIRLQTKKLMEQSVKARLKGGDALRTTANVWAPPPQPLPPIQPPLVIPVHNKQAWPRPPPPAYARPVVMPVRREEERKKEEEVKKEETKKEEVKKEDDVSKSVKPKPKPAQNNKIEKPAKDRRKVTVDREKVKFSSNDFPSLGPQPVIASNASETSNSATWANVLKTAPAPPVEVKKEEKKKEPEEPKKSEAEEPKKKEPEQQQQQPPKKNEEETEEPKKEIIEQKPIEEKKRGWEVPGIQPVLVKKEKEKEVEKEAPKEKKKERTSRRRERDVNEEENNKDKLDSNSNHVTINSAWGGKSFVEVIKEGKKESDKWGDMVEEEEEVEKVVKKDEKKSGADSQNWRRR